MCVCVGKVAERTGNRKCFNSYQRVREREGGEGPPPGYTALAGQLHENYKRLPGYTALAGQLHENYKRLPGYAALAAQLHDSWLATG